MKDVVGGEINGFNDDTKIKEFVDDTDALVETFLKDKKQRYLKKGIILNDTFIERSARLPNKQQQNCVQHEKVLKYLRKEDSTHKHWFKYLCKKRSNRAGKRNKMKRRIKFNIFVTLDVRYRGSPLHNKTAEKSKTYAKRKFWHQKYPYTKVSKSVYWWHNWNNTIKMTVKWSN